MKKLITLIVLILTTGLIYGQETESNKKNLNAPNLKQLTIGIGTSGGGIPIAADLQFEIHRNISIGPILSYQSWNEPESFGTVKYSSTGFGGQIVYHWNNLLSIPSNWDVYSSATLGYHSYKATYNNQPIESYYNGYNGGVGLWYNVGGKYFFNEKLGVALDLGYNGVGHGGRVGLAIRL
jgi:outer membrane immunogenic protein